MRMAPKPRRWTGRSPPRRNVPLGAALRACAGIDSPLRLRALVLLGPGHVDAKRARGVQWPVGIAQQFPRQQDGVSGPAADDVIRLLRLGDQPYRAGGDACFGADGARE